MKNLTRIIMAVALLGGSFLLGSCTKSEFGQAGKLIQFGARADGASTKTAYAGKDNDASGIEPIWWMQDDKVVIASPQAVVTNSNGEHQSTYKFSAYTTDNSHASVVNAGSNGLAWLDEDPDGGYDFYAVYGEGMSVGSAEGNEGDIFGSIPSPQTVTAHKYDAKKTATTDWYYVDENNKYTVYEPEMKYALMTAATTKVKSTDNPVSLIFKPAFTAFEFTFESADPAVKINLTEFRMESLAPTTENGYTSPATALSGSFTGEAGASEFTPNPTASNTVALGNPSALGEITSEVGKSFTIFALPQDLTNLKVYFADKDADGATRTRSLLLNDKNGTPLVFEAGHKYRIRGLKLPGNQYQFFLTLNGVVQEWTVKDLETVFTDQIQCSALTFDKSAKEETTEWQQSPTGGNGRSNHYDYTAPIGDGRWQVRTLNSGGLDNEKNHTYFTVSFLPAAPLGGYWRLVPHNEQFWTIQVVGRPGAIDEDDSLTPLPSEGRILNERVYLRITPNIEAIEAVPLSTETGLYFDCYFSTNIDFDPMLNANTEFQDIHGSGQYSYWLLRIDRMN